MSLRKIIQKKIYDNKEIAICHKARLCLEWAIEANENPDKAEEIWDRVTMQIKDSMEWIKVTDRKPEIGQFVLVYGQIVDCYGYTLRDKLDYAWYNDDYFTIGYSIGQPWKPLYWMPLAELPELEWSNRATFEWPKGHRYYKEKDANDPQEANTEGLR